MNMIDIASPSINEDEKNAVRQWLEYLPSVDEELMLQPSLWEGTIQEMQNNTQESASFADCLTQCIDNLSPMMKTAHNDSDLGYQISASLFDPSVSVLDDEPLVQEVKIGQCYNFDMRKKSMLLPNTQNIENLEFKGESSEVEEAYANVALDDAGDGFNWRKYGQKHVKETNCPRSYYRCTFPGCPAKKQVEKNKDGTVSNVIRKGKHNHPSRGSQYAGHKDSQYECNSCKMNHFVRERCKPEVPHMRKRSRSLYECDSHGNLPYHCGQQGSFHSGVQQVVQIETEENVIEDGYRWRKYGQKLVKGSTYPRSYYRCTASGCKVRKHTERSKDDPKFLVTTYNGVHNHAMETKNGRFLIGMDQGLKIEQEVRKKTSKDLPKSGEEISCLEGPVQSAVDMAENYLFEGEDSSFLRNLNIQDNASSHLPLSISIPDERCVLYHGGSKMYNPWTPTGGNFWIRNESIDALAMLREPLTPVS